VEAQLLEQSACYFHRQTLNGHHLIAFHHHRVSAFFYYSVNGLNAVLEQRGKRQLKHLSNPVRILQSAQETLETEPKLLRKSGQWLIPV
jgi:hypothetical protein